MKEVVWEVAELPGIGTCIWEGEDAIAQMVVYSRLNKDQNCSDERQLERAKLIASAPQMLDLLKQLEWSATLTIDADEHSVSYVCCPMCGRAKYKGKHSHTCKLGKVLKECEAFGRSTSRVR